MTPTGTLSCYAQRLGARREVGQESTGQHSCMHLLASESDKPATGRYFLASYSQANAGMVFSFTTSSRQWWYRGAMRAR